MLLQTETIDEAKLQEFIIKSLRAASLKWEPKSQCMKNASTRRGFKRCNHCKQEVPVSLPPKPGNKKRIVNVFADHIKPVIDPLTGFVDYNTYVERLFVSLKGYQCLCKACHDAKTAEENAIRRQAK